MKLVYAALLTVLPQVAGLMAYVGNPDHPETYWMGLRMSFQVLVTYGLWPAIFNFGILAYVLLRSKS